jgi:hypothetical protein
MVPTDGDDNIIGEPVIVDGLVIPFCRFAASALARIYPPVLSKSDPGILN